MEALVAVFIEKLEATLLELARRPKGQCASDWQRAVRVLAAVNELYDSVHASSTTVAPKRPVRDGDDDDDDDDEDGEEEESGLASEQEDEDEEEAVQPLGGRALERLELDDMEDPVRDQGEVLLATWSMRGGVEWSVWNFGHSPFRVSKNNKELYATCGVLMRATCDGATLVVRSNESRRFQVCLLSTPWPHEWYPSPWVAIHAVPNLPAPFVKWTQGPSFVNSCFSLAQNHVVLGRFTKVVPKGLRYTDEGLRLLPTRPALPHDDQAVPSAPKKARTRHNDNDDE